MYADPSISEPTQVFTGTEKDISADLLGIDPSLGYEPESAQLFIQYAPTDAFSDVQQSEDQRTLYLWANSSSTNTGWIDVQVTKTYSDTRTLQEIVDDLEQQ